MIFKTNKEVALIEGTRNEKGSSSNAPPQSGTTSYKRSRTEFTNLDQPSTEIFYLGGRKLH